MGVWKLYFPSNYEFSFTGMHTQSEKPRSADMRQQKSNVSLAAIRTTLPEGAGLSTVDILTSGRALYEPIKWIELENNIVLKDAV